jgi:hypothetical protein
VLILAGCHGGAAGGSGAPCALDKPCRAAFTCVAGRCQPSDGGLPNSPDLVAERPADAQSDAAVDSQDGDVVVDVAPEVVMRCDHEQPFSTIALVGGIGTGPTKFNSAARLSPDEKQVFFASSLQGTYAIYEAIRDSRDVDFGPPIFLSELNTSSFDSNPSVTGDGVTMLFESRSAGRPTILKSTRNTPGGQWTKPEFVRPFNPPLARDWANEGQPYVLPKGDILYFRASIEGVQRIFRAARDEVEDWKEPQLAKGFFDEGEFSPVVTEDDQTIYFATSHGRAEDAAADGGVPEPGDSDIWISTRGAKGLFDAPRRAVGINTTEGETPSWISPDACRLYFSRRAGTTEISEVYVATRTPR